MTVATCTQTSTFRIHFCYGSVARLDRSVHGLHRAFITRLHARALVSVLLNLGNSGLCTTQQHRMNLLPLQTTAGICKTHLHTCSFGLSRRLFGKHQTRAFSHAASQTYTCLQQTARLKSTFFAPLTTLQGHSCSQTRNFRCNLQSNAHCNSALLSKCGIPLQVFSCKYGPENRNCWHAQRWQGNLSCCDTFWLAACKTLAAKLPPFVKVTRGKTWPSQCLPKL